MFVETEKNVGDKVYFLKKINKVTCEVCNGTGKIHLTRPMNIDQGYDSPDEFSDALVQQFAQNCADVALGNVREYDCPECHGAGTVKAKSPKYEVGHGTVVGIEYSQTVSGTKLIYRVSEDDNGSTPRKLTDDCVWLTEDAAQWKCDFLNLERRMVPIECIQIPHTNEVKSQIRDSIGFPNITNFFEYSQLKEIYEMRDNPNLICHWYTKNEYTGKWIYQGTCIGYGIPYGAAITAPESSQEARGGGSYWNIVPLAEPNGLYTESVVTTATWILSSVDGEIKPIYVESEITVSQTKLDSRLCEDWSIPDNY